MILAADTAIAYCCFDTETENMIAGAEMVYFISFRIISIDEKINLKLTFVFGYN